MYGKIVEPNISILEFTIKIENELLKMISNKRPTSLCFCF